MIAHGLPCTDTRRGRPERHPGRPADPAGNSRHAAAAHRRIGHQAPRADSRRQRRQSPRKTQLVRTAMKTRQSSLPCFLPRSPPTPIPARNCVRTAWPPKAVSPPAAASPNAYQSAQGRALHRLHRGLRRRLCGQRPPGRIGRGQAQRILPAEERRPFVPAGALRSRPSRSAAAQSRKAARPRSSPPRSRGPSRAPSRLNRAVIRG